jgi:4-oxalocrotonate tautomerase
MEVAVPIVSVLQGPREVAPKRELVAGITQVFVDAYGLPPETVQVWIQEVPTDSWAVAGKLTAD